MSGKIILTKHVNHLLVTLFQDQKPFSMDVIPVKQNDSNFGIGTICLAKVSDVVKGMKGAFLTLQDGCKAYLPFDKNSQLLCANREITSPNDLHKDDQVVVQIVSEPLKTKPYTVSTDLTITGQYCVCSLFDHGIKYSKKLSEDDKSKLKEGISHFEIKGRKSFGFTIRTNTGTLEELSPLKEEMTNFVNQFENLLSTYKHRTLYSIFYQNEHPLLTLIKNFKISDYEEIVTDDPEYVSLLTNGFDAQKVRYYQDSLLPLAKLYSIETHLKEALSKKVWLPSGGYLVIEPTEAMVVIDVNSGKASGSNKKKDLALQVNLEAAKEIARQLRLRNYSGMIMVDFINLKQKNDEKQLLNHLSNELIKDRIHTRLVDITALGVVEITRKKQNKSLESFFKNTLDSL